MLAIIIAVKTWQKMFKNRNLLAFCDNKVTVEVVNRGKANNKFSQECLRELCYQLAMINSNLKLIFLEGRNNKISDSLSRWGNSQQRSEFWKLTAGKNVQFDVIQETQFEFTNQW